ncbi:hypothetical protein [Rufibacter radiotolerans]|uniref:hypothetical protein n=1 Tax=Rufibacter radiotolerans TaxID=1379910 RepID=UPI000B0016F9|nr:hypothetical protein [Rufibacter radiotolerans]
MNTKVQVEIGVNGKERAVEMCGLVMPSSPIDGVSAEHWREVLSIVTDVIRDSEFEPQVTCHSDETCLVKKDIIQTMYNNPLMVFDVSGKNPNVMFALGMRLAFDKPTIIIKDDATNYTFDSFPIEPITYPRGLRFTAILAFQKALKGKIEEMALKLKENATIGTFLEILGEYKKEKPSASKESAEKFMLDSIEKLMEEVKTLKNTIHKEAAPVVAHHAPQAGMNNLTEIFLRPENLEIFVAYKIDQYVKMEGLQDRSVVEKQRLQHKVFEFITSSNPELDNDVIERLILEVINSQIKTGASTMVA